MYMEFAEFEDKFNIYFFSFGIICSLKNVNPAHALRLEACEHSKALHTSNPQRRTFMNHILHMRLETIE